MRLTDENVFTIATWETPEGSFRAVRGITEEGVSVLYSLLIPENIPLETRVLQIAEFWKRTQAIDRARITLLKNHSTRERLYHGPIKDEERDEVVAMFSYGNSWSAVSKPAFYADEERLHYREVRCGELPICASVWHDVIGQERRVPLAISVHRSPSPPSRTVQTLVGTQDHQAEPGQYPQPSFRSDPSMYRLLGVIPPWLTAQAKFLDWVKFTREEL